MTDTAAKKIYFFSDVHLGVGTPEQDRSKEARLIRFLDAAAADAGEIIIVGDLFDYWFEYRSVVPKGYVRLLSRFAALTDRGVAVSYVAGNHDFWMKDYFAAELGIRLHFEPVERMIHGKRFYIHHGDGLLKNDRGYLIMKRVFRSPFNIRLFSLLHPDMATAISRWVSGESRKRSSGAKYENSGLLEYATGKIREGFDFVVMGHSHLPLRQVIDGGTYVNLGEWLVSNTYAVFDGTTIELRTWNQ